MITELTEKQIANTISKLREAAKHDGISIDGIVFTYDSIPYSRSCGRTGHHYKDGLAYKFEDDLRETVLRHIEWQPSRFGELSPVAVFDTVEIDGCEVSRASLHNLTFIRELELHVDCRILVSKRNMIIPHVEENLDRGRFSEQIIPALCPCCANLTRIQESGKEKGRIIQILRCDNPGCAPQRTRQFVHFVGKKAIRPICSVTSFVPKFRMSLGTASRRQRSKPATPARKPRCGTPIQTGRPSLPPATPRSNQAQSGATPNGGGAIPPSQYENEKFF